jgi:Beta-propeller repeat
MKMRASLAKGMMFGIAALCVIAIVLFIASRNEKFAARQTGAARTLLAAKGTAKADPKWTEAYGKLPMGFEENLGQTNSEVRFLSHGQGYQLFLTAQEAVLQVRSSKPLDFSPRHRLESSKTLRARKQQGTTSVVRMRIAGANPHLQIAGLNQLPGKSNYFVGNDSKNWRTDVPSYARVKYSDVYPGIDLVFYGNQRRLEYDYVIAPGADPKAIALDITGARKLRIDERGNLVMEVPGGEVELQKPLAYQDVNGARQEIASNYTVSGDHRINLSVGDYDNSKELVVDPVLNYSTYLGGSVVGDQAYGIAVDGSGNAYVAGLTYSSTFPTTGNAYDSTPTAATTSSGSVFVTELDPTGETELYSTYLGGSGGEFAFGVAVDSASPTNVYVTGQTFSSDFPIVNGYITTNAGVTGFVSKITPTLSGVSSLVYSSYVAGINGDYGNAIAADSSQNAYITGITFSTGINTASAYQTSPTDSADGNAFLTRIDTTQSGANSLIYSTYLGGNGANANFNGNSLTYADQGYGVAVGSNVAYVIGSTSSTDFPTLNGFQSSPTAGNVEGTVFMSAIDTTKSGTASLAYSTYVSGEVFEDGYAIALGQSGVAYLTGITFSTQFPVSTGAFQTSYLGAGSDNAFVTLIDTTKSGTSSLKYSTYLGGNNGDAGQGIQADSAGNAYVAGATGSITAPNTVPSSLAFPLTSGALQTNSSNAAGVAFIAEISPNGAGAADLVYSSLFGGDGVALVNIPDRAFGIALDSSNNAYIAGQTASTDFPFYPNPGAFQTSLTGSDGSSIASAFVAKLTLTPTVVVSPTALSFGTVLDGVTSAAQTVTITNNTGAVVPYTLTLLGGNAADFAAVPGGGTPCGVGNLAASATPCTISVTFTPTANGAEASNLFVGYTTFGITSSQVVTLTGTGTNLALNVSPGVLTFTGQLVTTTSATQPVTVTNSSVSDGAVSLTNATDFSYTVAPGGPAGCTLTTAPANTTCIYNVAFNPASGDTGALTSTFSVTAGANTQTATLNGIGWDFNFSPSTQTVSTAPGGTSSPTLTANFLGGFPGPVTLSCTGSIPKGSCTVPGSVTASGSSSVAVPVTVTITTAGSSAAPPASFRFPPISRRQVVLIGFSVLLLFTLPFARRRRSKVGLVGALVMIIGLTACSGSSGTPAGAYPLTISGTSNGVTRTATITLNVT